MFLLIKIHYNTKSENISIYFFISVLIHTMAWIILIHIGMIRITNNLRRRIVFLQKYQITISLFFCNTFRILYCFISIVIAVWVFRCLSFFALISLLLKFRMADFFVSFSLLTFYLMSIRSLLLFNLFKSVVLYGVFKRDFYYYKIIDTYYTWWEIDFLLFY